MGRTDFRNAILCAAAVAAAFLVVNPFAQMPFNDDFSYAFTVKRLLETGNILFNGWSAPVLVTHVLWGALFAKVFGYSFVTLRFSTLPLAAGSAFVTYLLARDSRLPPAESFLATLTLCLSPLFLPLALSFMTDVPAVFFTLLSLYALARCARTAQSKAAIAWLVVGTAVGIFGGMGRQTVWIVPLLIVPYCVILRRRQPWFLVAAAVCWLAVFTDVLLTVRWFDRHPWAFIDPPITDYVRAAIAQPAWTESGVIAIAFTTVLFALPALVPFAFDSLAHLWRNRKTWQAATASLVVLAMAVGVSRNPRIYMGPWLFGIVTVKGVLGTLWIEVSGNRAFTIPLYARGFISALVLMCCYLLIARSVESALQPRAFMTRLIQFFSSTDPRPMLTIFGIAYFALMVARNSLNFVFDRYCLPMVPCLAIPILAVAPLRAVAKPVVILTWTLFGVYALYACASTQDNLALAAARRTAINRLEAAGVPRTEIAGGLDYDFYTQLQERGHIPRAGIKNPPNAFVPSEGYLPVMNCRYRLEYPTYSNTEPSRFGEVDYISWLPPFRRKVLIDQFTSPWWLDPHRAGTVGAPKDFEIVYQAPQE
jgi:hypothetical protein